MGKLIKKLLISSILIASVAAVNAEEVKQLKVQAETNVANMDMVIKDNFVKSKQTSAESRFAQNNIKASYDDFNDLIQKASHDDYVFLIYGMKMAEFGFFDLSDALINKLDANIFTSSYARDIRKYYYPAVMLNQRDIIYLADAYSNIVYNNMAIETTSELLSSNQTGDSDYKNYLISLGYYKSNNLQQALKYINNAIIQNDTNINYLSLKAKILADLNKPKQALKVLDKIKKTEFLTIDFQNKIRAVEEYILYKTAKDEPLKDYHLAYYYHLQDKSLLATKVLQASVLQAKEHSSMIFSLLGKIYYDNNEPLKAQEFATRAYKENKSNYLTIITLADLNYDQGKYEVALKYYKKAQKLTKNAEPEVGIAKTYLALEKDKKSQKLYEKLLKKYSTNEDLFVASLDAFPQKADYYLPKAASINISNNDVWLGLANLALRDNDFNLAATYLNNSYYIDANNFKYYYYLSLVLRAKGDIELANQSLIKCSRLNSDYAADVNPEYSVYEK